MAKQRVLTEYRSKTDLVVAAIKEMIHTGELQPGAALRQRETAELFGVSATPVREAFRRLEGEGFLTAQAHSTVVVVRSEDRALYENAQIRAALESLGTELSAQKATEEDLLELEEMNREFAKTSGETAVELNRQFHFRLYEIAASPVLRAQLRLMWQMLDGGPRVERPVEESARQHQLILDAIRRHESSEAAEVVRRHILEAVPKPDDE